MKLFLSIANLEPVHRVRRESSAWKLKIRNGVRLHNRHNHAKLPEPVGRSREGTLEREREPRRRRRLWKNEKAGHGLPDDEILREVISTCFETSLLRDEDRTVRFRLMLRDPQEFTHSGGRDERSAAPRFCGADFARIERIAAPRPGSAV